MEIEEIKRQLDELSRRLDRIEREKGICPIAEIEAGKIKSARTKLMTRYKRFARFGLLMCPAILIFYRHWIPDMPRVAMAVFFLIASCMDFYLWYSMRGIDISTMGVAEVARKAIYYRKIHHIFMAILIALLIPILYLWVSTVSGNSAMLWGMCAGGVVGLAIGIKFYLDFMRQYRQMA